MTREDRAGALGDETMEAIKILREFEVAWLSRELADSIANLGYPVGCGIAPNPEHLEKAAGKLFDRYSKMIEWAARKRITKETGSE